MTRSEADIEGLQSLSSEGEWEMKNKSVIVTILPTCYAKYTQAISASEACGVYRHTGL